MIIAGWSAYPRQLDFARASAPSPTNDDAAHGDMAHFAGPGRRRRAPPHCAARPRRHPPPPPQDALGGPAAASSLRNDPAIEDQFMVFLSSRARSSMSRSQGHRAFKMAAQPEFAQRQQRCLDGARILAGRLTQPDVAERGIAVL